MAMSPEDLKMAEALLVEPDAEDCERFSSRYGSQLLTSARSQAELLSATQALGVIGGGYCFCSAARDPDKADHEPECAELRAAIANSEA